MLPLTSVYVQLRRALLIEIEREGVDCNSSVISQCAFSLFRPDAAYPQAGLVSDVRNIRHIAPCECVRGWCPDSKLFNVQDVRNVRVARCACAHVFVRFVCVVRLCACACSELLYVIIRFFGFPARASHSCIQDAWRIPGTSRGQGRWHVVRCCLPA